MTRRATDRSPAPVHRQRTLFDGSWLQIGHIEVRPASTARGPVELAAHNTLALPLAGVFALHDGPREQVLATPNHGLFISAGRPYRLSFPGGIGDRCLALRFTPAALARVMPQAMAGAGFDLAAFAPHTLLSPAVMLARSRLSRRLAPGNCDPLEAETLGIELLGAVLRGARRCPAGAAEPVAGEARRRRRVERVIEAVWTQPERRWTLEALAAEAHVSASHLAHGFRADMGLSVYDYVLRSRLARALDAVLDTERGLTEIALDAGFASHSHFTARFRALFGHTPLDLRRSIDGATARKLRRIVTAREALLA